MAKQLRIGVIGLGNMGLAHAQNLAAGKIPGAVVSAVCDADAARVEKVGAELNVKQFSSNVELLSSGSVDAILIAVPHYDHVPIAMDAFEKDIHVMCEKPIAVSVTDARRVNAAFAKASARNPDLRFGIMFQVRTNAMYKKLRELILDGELGNITRITCVVTNWFRSNTYYASGGWRATWKGEGGGVLINQCPHNLDILQWVTGLMPHRITAVGTVGKFHPIEVEDEISAILEFSNGAVGQFVTTTGEYPGTNRLEIAGDRGKIVAEGGKLTFNRTRQSVSQINQTTPESFPSPQVWSMDIPVGPINESHNEVLSRFVDVIHKGLPATDLIAQGIEGVSGLEIGNAMLMSALTRQPVNIPVDGPAYDQFILDMHAKHGGKKRTSSVTPAQTDMASSFSR